MKRLLLAIVATFAVVQGLVCPSHADASILYAYSANRAGLISIDPSTGQPTFIGETGVILSGLAFDTNSRTLYGSAVSTQELYTVDTTTGLASLVGGFNVSPRAFMGGGLTFDAVTNTLYSAGTVETDDSLYSIDAMTGQATLAGNTGVNISSSGLAFNSDASELFLANARTDTELYELDEATGAVERNIDSLEGRFFSLAYDSDGGTLFGVQAGSSLLLYSIDTTNGDLQLVSDLSGEQNIPSLAYAPTAAVPEPSSVAIWALGLIGCAGYTYRKRRRKAA